ncbi:hypothetical protein [Flavobacterium sangjuense]|uniref:Uncharacterized protein n=1 Tax=Flavobacterium sangjuense TaxID=2518177 RepID=A0A4P7PS61_9FLAO|nr:hypothetical protein [Flavobacterium sangjuense]QBZ96972.1 hypothetical protein GS03_00457 [Flavobacterium sangjuense]
MKNLLFGLIATVLFAFNGNAQKITQESVRLQLAQGMSDFTISLKPAFDKTTNVEDFKKTITGSWYSKIPKEGNDLLNASYKLLISKTSQAEILKSYNGKEMAVALLYIHNLSVKGVKTDGSELFGGTTGDFNPYAANAVSAKCRWYQLSCWIKEIFGDEGGGKIMDTIVTVLTILIAGL